MANPTIDNVAQLAGVSIKTVSRVVNQEPNVKQQTRDKVQAAIDELGYKPNLSARSLASKRSYLVSLLYDNFLAASAYVVNLQCGVIERCRQEGYELLIHPLNYQAPNLIEEIERFINASGIDGLMLTPPLSDDPKLIDALKTLGKPFVRISPATCNGDASCVYTDDRQVADEMTQHLIDQGHRQIAFIAGRPDHLAVGQRQLGYEDAMHRNGLTPSTCQGYSSFETGAECARQLLQAPQRPTAIFAGNDEMATGAISTAHEMGIAIPAQLSVAGFDDNDLATHCWPAMTTVRQPVAEMAAAAADILLQSLKTKQPPVQQLQLQSSVVVRQSTAAISEPA
ncbi:LacI family DNA-binding transcriptional regulator [Oceanobacter kriegii]|uniref:LacI family DNA-binding transcriptional regulator n=1 Tax=Oceanobacter kriegii TaxID=64972 RepID=UPI00041A973C|nr:LacI family DNA-binding transcriptional regulator [Oceanobacter kriegii]